MVIKEFFSVPILSVVAGSSVAFRSPVVERFYCNAKENNCITYYMQQEITSEKVIKSTSS